MTKSEYEGGFVSHLAELRKRLIHSFILLFIGFKSTGATFLKSSVFWLIIILLLIISISYFGINPLLESLNVNDLPKELMKGVFAERFDNWYGIASIAYLIECVLGIFLLLKIR